MVKKNTCVFISGRGSNLKNLIRHTRDNNFPIKISLVICNNKNAFGAKYAKKYNYAPNPNASSLASGKSNTIGFVIPLYGLNASQLNQTSFFEFKMLQSFINSSIFNVGPHLIPIGFSIPLQNSTWPPLGCLVLSPIHTK